MKKIAAGFLSAGIALLVGAQFVNSALAGPSAGIVASATLSGVPDGGNFDYTLTLSNAPNATTSIEGFWYAWIPGFFFLPTVPSSASGGTSGWAPLIFSNSIQFQGAGTNAIGPGQSKTFIFVSTDTPAALAGTSSGHPIGRSVAYPGVIDFGDSPPDDEITVQSVAAVPEPSSVVLVMIGVVGLLATRLLKG